MPCNLEPSTKRHKAQGRIALLFVLIALALTALPTTSFAGTDTAGNVLATEADSNPSSAEGDLYWAGQSLNLDDASIGRDIIAAGDSLSIRDCTVGGAVRLAARTIDISKTAIDGSVTVAGQHVVLNTGSTASCFYAMGETVALRGSAKSAALAGSTVTIDGTVDGDIEVWADKLAHISEDPERAEGAQVGALKIDRTENEDTSTINDTIGGIVAAALSTCFVAILLELVLPRATASAAGMLRQRPTPLWVSGLLGTVAAVPAVLLLTISIAGLSLAGALMCAVIGIALVSAAFTGTAIARMVGHNQNRYAMAVVGGIAAGVLTALPLMGSFVSGVAFIFTLGYVIQIIWRNARLKPQQDSPPPSRQPHKGDRHLCGGADQLNPCTQKRAPTAMVGALSC